MHRQQLSTTASMTHNEPLTDYLLLIKRQPFRYINNFNTLSISQFYSLYIIDSEMYVVSNKHKAVNCTENFAVVEGQLCEVKQLQVGNA